MKYRLCIGLALLGLSFSSAALAKEQKSEEQAHWTDKIEIDFKKGVTLRTTDDKFSIRFHFLLQPQVNALFVENGPNTHGFLIHLAQVEISGNLVDPRIKYKFMFQNTMNPGGATVFDFRDAWLEWQWTEAFHIRFGQQLIDFDHENIQPTWGLHLADRSIINKNLGFERDIGVELNGKLFSQRTKYYLFVMNGDGRNTINQNQDYIFGLRFIHNLLGEYYDLIADIDNSKTVHLALGAGYLFDTGNAAINNNPLHRATADLSLRYKGFSLLLLTNLARNTALNATDYGFLGQTGYFLVPNHLETVLQWAALYPNGAVGQGTVDSHEGSAGLNYYFSGHRIKLQTDYSLLINNAATQNRNDHRVRLQAQLYY